MGRVGVGRAVRDSKRGNQLGERDLEDAFATGCLLSSAPVGWEH